MLLKIGTLTVNKIASYSEGKYHMANGVDKFIWNRRQDLQGYNLKILMIESHPWTKISLDILDVLQSGLNFSYTIEFKKKYGMMLENESWNGVIGELSKKHADIGLIDFSGWSKTFLFPFCNFR